MDGKSQHTWSIHMGLFAAEAICTSAFVVELLRALSGNTLSWAYVFEWPILGTYAVYMWRKLLKEEKSGETATPPAVAPDDPKLAAWNEYLAQVHANDQSDQKPS